MAKHYKTARIRIEQDTEYTIEEMLGDTFKPECNPDKNPTQLEHEKQLYIESLDRDGVYGIVAEYWNGQEWLLSDSCWGFEKEVPGEVRKEYLEQALRDYRKQTMCPHCSRPLAPVELISYTEEA